MSLCPLCTASLIPSGASIDIIIVAYLVSMAVSIPVSGWLGDRFGTRLVFLTVLAAFTGASLLCGLSHTLGQLVAARILQGIAAGLLSPVGTTMLYRTFPPEGTSGGFALINHPNRDCSGARPGIGRLAGRSLILDLGVFCQFTDWPDSILVWSDLFERTSRA